VLPARDGPYRIEALAFNGRVIFSHAFEGERPSDVPDREVRHFALRFRWTAQWRSRLLRCA
jgi:hypothetical protein